MPLDALPSIPATTQAPAPTYRPDPAPLDVLQARFLRAGAGALQQHELLALLLRGSVPDNQTNTVARRLLAAFGTLPHTLAANHDELCAVSGVGKRTASAIKIAETLGRLLAAADLPDEINPVLSNYDAVIDYCRTRIGFKRHEEFHLIFLNNRNALIRAELHQRGTTNRTPAYPREIVHRALQLRASAIILAHNHPAGDPTPSRTDIETTNKVRDAAQLFNITLHDHLIVTPTAATSFSARGLI